MSTLSRPPANYYYSFAGFYFFYCANGGVFLSYWSLYLKSLHFDAIDITVLMSLRPAMFVVAPYICGWLSDYTGKRREVLIVATSLFVLFYLAVFVTVSFWGLFAAMLLMGFFWSVQMPLVDATAMSWLDKNAAYYGRLRSWGSIGFILAVTGLGYAFDYITVNWLLWVMLTCIMGTLFFAFHIPPTAVSAHHTDHQPIGKIILQPRVMALFSACFLMSVAHGPYYTFFSIYLVEHGYANSVVGWLWALGVICEIGALFLMPALMRHFDSARILLFSLAAAVLRFLLIGWEVDVIVLLLFAQTLHALTFGVHHAASVGLVHELFRGRHQSQGQALYTSLTFGVGSMAGVLMSGPIWQLWGATALYSFAAGMAALGLLLMWWKSGLLSTVVAGAEGAER